MAAASPNGSLLRARRSFRLLVVVAVLAAGSLSAALAAEPGPLTALLVAVSGVLLAGSLGLATRVMVAIDRKRQPPHAR